MAEAAKGVRVTFQDPSGATIGEGIVPFDLPVRQILPGVLARTGLALEEPDGTPRRYGLVHPAIGCLREDDSLQSAGVRDGDRLIVQPAGAWHASPAGPPPPFPVWTVLLVAVLGSFLFLCVTSAIGLRWLREATRAEVAEENSDESDPEGLGEEPVESALPVRPVPEPRVPEPVNRTVENPQVERSPAPIPMRRPKPPGLSRDGLRAAERAWEAGRQAEARALLEACPEAVRDWEWHHLRRTFDGLGPLVIAGHDTRVVSLAFTPDGARFASGSSEDQIIANQDSGLGVVKFWEPATGELLGRIHGGQYLTFLAFSPDGKRLVTGNDEQILRLWDSETYAGLGALPWAHSSGITGVAFSPDGRQVASASFDCTIKIWDLPLGKDVRTLDVGQKVEAVAFSPDGRFLASCGHDRKVRLFGLVPGLGDRTLLGHAHLVHSVAFSPDGTTLASGGVGGKVDLWDIETGSLIHALGGHRRAVRAVAFGPEGRTLASAAADSTVRVWDTSTGELVRTLTAESKHHFMSVAFSPDGKFLAAGRSDGTVTVWGATTNP